MQPYGHGILKQDNLAKLGRMIFSKILRETSSNQKYEQILIECEKNNRKYQDNTFPPIENSLIKGFDRNDKSEASQQNLKKWKRIIWLTPENFSIPSNKIFSEQVEPIHLKQGALSNYYFLSTVAALCEHPHRIKKLFLTEIYNNFNIAAVKLCIDGTWTEIIIDLFFPCDNKKKLPCFASNKQDDLWILILEKCYAKAYGSYLRIEEGLSEQAIRDFTGAPSIIYDNSDDNLWSVLYESSKKKFIITASAGDTEASKELLKEAGLIASHSYSILGVFDLQMEDYQEYLLKISNPWGHTEWLGDWSDHSTIWNTDIKARINYENKKDGSFYMNFKDFKHYFSKVQICKVYDDYQYKSLRMRHQKGSYSLVKMTLENSLSANIVISLIQQDKRNFNSSYRYSIGRFIISKILEDGSLEYICGKMAQEKDFFEERRFDDGSYLIYIEFEWNEFDYPFVLSTYSEFELNLVEVPREEYKNILESIYISCALKDNMYNNFDNDGAPRCYKYSCENPTPEGYIYIYFVNDEEDATLIEDVKYTKFEGLKLIQPFLGSSYLAEVKSGERKMVLIKRIDLNGFSLAYSSHSNFKFGRKSLIYLTKTKGKKISRKDPKLSIDLQIYVYTYKHSLGLCFYYENNTNDRRLHEKVTISSTGVDIVDCELIENKVSITLGPGENKLLEIQAKNNNWSVQSSVVYRIENL